MKIVKQLLCENYIEQTFEDGTTRFVEYLVDENGETYTEMINPEAEKYTVISEMVN